MIPSHHYPRALHAVWRPGSRGAPDCFAEAGLTTVPGTVAHLRSLKSAGPGSSDRPDNGHQNGHRKCSALPARCRPVFARVRLIQRFNGVNLLASAALREVAAAERFRWGLDALRDLLDSDPRLQLRRHHVTTHNVHRHYSHKNSICIHRPGRCLKSKQYADSRPCRLRTDPHQ